MDPRVSMPESAQDSETPTRLPSFHSRERKFTKPPLPLSATTTSRLAVSNASRLKIQKPTHKVDFTKRKQQTITSRLLPVSEDSIIVPDVKEDASVKAQNNTTESLHDVNNESLLVNESRSPPLSVKLKELSDYLHALNSATPMPRHDSTSSQVRISDTLQSGSFTTRSTGLKQAFEQNYLHFLNTATEDELKGTAGIKDKRASKILELREESPEPFKSLDDLQDLGLTSKQAQKMMKDAFMDIFS